jgi:hypothetical protein
MSDTTQKNRFSLPFVALVTGEALIYPLFVYSLIEGSQVFFWSVVIGMSAYIFATMIICTINASMGKIHIAFPIIATVIGIPGLMLIFVMRLIA